MLAQKLVVKGMPGASISRQNVAVKLPEISLPKYSSEQSQWISYRNLFNSLIDQNEGLDDASKMHYLISSLEGATQEIVKGLAISTDNYLCHFLMLNSKERQYLFTEFNKG